MTSPTFLIPLGFIMIVAVLLGAIADQSVNSTGDSSLGSTASSDLNAVLDFNVFDIKEVSLFNTSFGIPRPNFAFFSGMFNIMTWNYSYFTGTWALLRMFFLALSFAVSVLVFISMAPVLLSMVEFLGRTAAGVVGIFGGGFRFLSRSG